MKPIDSAWVVLKGDPVGEGVGGGGTVLQTSAPGAPGISMFGSQPVIDVGGGGGAQRPSTARLLHGLATGHAPKGAKRALLGRAAGTGVGLVNALMAVDRAQSSGDIGTALGAAYGGYQAPKQIVTGATEGEWSHKPMLGPDGQPLFDEKGKPRLQPKLTPGGAIGGQMEVGDMARSHYGTTYLGGEEDPINFPGYGNAPLPTPTPTMVNVSGGQGEPLPQSLQQGYGNVPEVQTQQMTAETAAGADPYQTQLGDTGTGYGNWLAPMHADDTWGQEVPVTDQTSLPPVGFADVFGNSEPMDVAFRMLKGAMR